jgi:WhiB family redox-sensing transcriptional regulator
MTDLRITSLTRATSQVDTDRADDWRELASCGVDDTAAFYPMSEKNGPWDDALEICADCRVRQACLDDAIDRRERFGMWGGKTPEQRQRIARSRRRKAASAAKKGDER